MSRFVGQSQYEELVSLLYEAALDVAVWPRVAASLHSATDLRGSHLAVVGDAPVDPHMIFSRFYCEGGTAADVEREYNEVYFPMDERMARIRSWPRGRLFHNRDVYTDEERKESPVYADFLRSVDGQNQAGIATGGTQTYVCWVLTKSFASEWEPEQVALIERLTPHLERIFAVRRALAAAGALDAALDALLANMRVGVFLLDLRGRIIETNGLARQMVMRGDALVDVDGRLDGRTSADNGRLRSAVGRSLPGASATPAASTLRVERAGAPPLAVQVLPLTRPAPNLAGAEVAAVVLVSDPFSQPVVDASRVADALGLTGAEARVAALLAEGRTIREIAGLVSRAEESVRWTLKRVFEKLGVNRQADLVRLVLSLPSV